MKIINLILKALQWIKNVVSKIIIGVLRFATHVVNWFKNLNLDQHKDIPFIANSNSAEFKEMLKNAPVRNVGIFQGVYDEETDRISHCEYLAADSIDDQTRQVLGDEKLVVLN